VLFKTAPLMFPVLVYRLSISLNLCQLMDQYCDEPPASGWKAVYSYPCDGNCLNVARPVERNLHFLVTVFSFISYDLRA
jgi:hypothetical protein